MAKWRTRVSNPVRHAGYAAHSSTQYFRNDRTPIAALEQAVLSISSEAKTTADAVVSHAESVAFGLVIKTTHDIHHNYIASR